MNPAQSLRLLAWTIWYPSRAFQTLHRDPRWLVAFLVIGLGAAFTTWLTVPALQSVSFRLLSQTLSTEQSQQLALANRIAHYAGTLAAPVVTLVFWFATAFLIWMVAQVFDGLPSFRAIFAVVAHANVTSLFSGILVAAILAVRLQSEVASLQDLDIRLGLDLFWDGQIHPAFRVVLANFNPFNLWYYGLLVMGTGAVCEFTYLRTIAVIGTLWALNIAFSAGSAWVISSLTVTTPT